MKILIITHYFPPLNSIASHRPYSWAKYWSIAGHDITVLTTKKSKSTNDLNLDLNGLNVIEVTSKLYNKIIGYSTKKAVEIKLSSTDSEKSKSLKIISNIREFVHKKGVLGTVRMPDFTDLLYNQYYSAISNQKYDVVVSTAGPYIVHLVAARIKKNGGANYWIADYRDLWTSNHIYKGVFPFRIIELILERYVNLNANLVTTVSEPLVDQLRNTFKLKNAIAVENGFDTDDLLNLSKDCYWNDDKVRIVYTGSIYYEKRDPSPLFSAINQISQSEYDYLLDRLEVLFVGSNKADLDFLIEKYDVAKWVRHGGSLKREDALRMQRDADVLLFLEYEAEGIDGILTGKLFEYIAAGTTIWGIGITDNCLPGKIIRESLQGQNFGNDVGSIKNQLQSILSAEKILRPKVNSDLLNKYSRKSMAEKLLNKIKNDLIEQNNIGC